MNILIIEDHLLVAEAWKLILCSCEDFQHVHHCRSAEDGIVYLESFKPDIVLLDVNLPGINGIEAVSGILAVSPKSKIIGLSIHTQTSYVKKMLANGAHGYVTKNSSKEEFFKAIREVMADKKYICTEIVNILTDTLLQSDIVPDLNKLSEREMEIIHLLKQGLTSKEISEKKGISVKTVESHRYNILRKLKMNNTATLIDYINTKYPHI